MVKKMSPAPQPTRDPYCLMYQIPSVTAHWPHVHYKAPQVNSPLHKVNFFWISDLSFPYSHEHYHITATIVISQSSSRNLQGRSGVGHSGVGASSL